MPPTTPPMMAPVKSSSALPFLPAMASPFLPAVDTGVGTGVGSEDGAGVLQSLSSSKSVASLPLVVPQGQVVQLSPEPSSDELNVPSGHTAQSEEAEAQ